MRMPAWCFVVLALICCSPLGAQQVSFKGSVSNDKVSLGEYFQVSFTLKNAKAASFSAPSFQGFDVLSGPNITKQATVVNGVASSEVIWSYYLQPKKIGVYQIALAKVLVNGKELSSLPIQVEVRSQDQANKALQSNGKDVFLQASISKERAVIGEQLVLKYTVYTSKDISSFALINESKLDGCFVEELSTQMDMPTVTRINGKRYVSKLIKSVAVFPQQEGTLHISPITIQVTIPDEGNQSDIFFNKRLKEVTLSSNTIDVQVGALGQVDANFCGIAGDLSAEMKVLNPGPKAVGEALILQMDMITNGDPNRVIMPNWSFGDSVEVLDLQLIDSRKEEEHGTLQSYRTYQCTVVPQYMGKYQLIPKLSYFDTKAAALRELALGTFELQVTKPSTQASIAQLGLENKERVSIAPLRTNAEINAIPRSLFAQGKFWTLFVFPFFLMGGMVALKRYQLYVAHLDKNELRQKHAFHVANEQLLGCEDLYQSGNHKYYHQTILNSLLGLVSVKFNVPKTTLHIPEAKELLIKHGLPQNLTVEFESICNYCEMALFAGVAQNANAEMLVKTKKLLLDLEQNWPTKTTMPNAV